MTILLPYSLDVQNSFFSFFRFYVFVNNKRTVIGQIFFRKYRYFNSLSNAIHPIQIHRVVLEKLRFEKSEKNFNLKYEISLKFMDQSFCPKNRLDQYTKSTPTKNFKAIKPILLQLCNDKKKITFFYKFFFLQK